MDKMQKTIIYALVFLCLVGAASAAMTDNLAAVFPLEGTGDATDVYAANGTYNYTVEEVGTVTETTGIHNNARTGFNDASNNCFNDDGIGVTFSNGYSISLWVNQTSTPGAGTHQSWHSTGSGAFMSIIPEWDHSISRPASWGQLQGGGGKNLDYGSTFTDNVWYHVVVTLNATNNNYTMYVNGAQVDTDTLGNSITAVDKFTIGADGSGCANAANAYIIDEMYIWNRTITPAEVSELYNGGTGFFYPFPGAATTDLNIQAQDDFNGSSINNFSASVNWGNGTTTEHSTTNGTIALTNISDSDLTINVTFYNATDYYNLTLLNQAVTANTTNTITGNIYQAVLTMNAKEKITGNATTSTFYTGSKSGTVFNITAGSHDIKAVTTGYYNKTQTFAITALTNTSQTVTGVYSAVWNLTVYNLINNSVVTNYSINITSVNYTGWAGENSSSTTGSYNFTGVNGTYTAVIDAPGYILQTFNFTIGATSGGANFSLYTQDSINLTFYDEETQALLSGYNITVELIGDLMSRNYSTMNGTLYVDLLTPQAYMIRYDDTNGTYGERFYYFNLTNRSNTALSLYLLNNGTEGYAAITATVYDETNHFVEGAIIKALRYYLNTNSYIVVDMGKTNFEGVTTLHLKQNEEFYKFIIEYPQGTTKKTTEPTQIYADTLNFQILLGTQTGARWYKSVDTIANVTFDEANNWFRLEWNDPENTLSRICLHTNLLTQFRNETINNTCSTSAAGVMYHPVDNVTGYTYHSQALAYYSDPPAPLAAAYHTFLATNPIGAIGLFMLVLVTIAFMFIGRWNLAVAVVLTPIPTMVASVAGLIAIPAYVTVPIQIVAVIIAYIISTRA